MIYRVLSVFCLTFALAACSDNGPMEEAGEKVDEIAVDAGNAIEDSCEKAKEGLGAEDSDC
jgi:hypothetical protein